MVRRSPADLIVSLLRFQLEFNLKDESFYPGRKLYDRVMSAAKRCELSFDILLQWQPPETGVSPDSPVAFLKSRLADLEYNLCSCRFVQQTFA